MNKNTRRNTSHIFCQISKSRLYGTEEEDHDWSIESHYDELDMSTLPVCTWRDECDVRWRNEAFFPLTSLLHHLLLMWPSLTFPILSRYEIQNSSHSILCVCVCVCVMCLRACVCVCVLRLWCVCVICTIYYETLCVCVCVCVCVCWWRERERESSYFVDVDPETDILRTCLLSHPPSPELEYLHVLGTVIFLLSQLVVLVEQTKRSLLL